MISYKTVTLNKKNITNFAKERNNLLKKTNNKWIFFLDSDEKIDNFKIIDNNLDYYFFKRKNLFLNQFVGNDYLVRLVKKDSGKWVRRVHEVWLPKNKLRSGLIKKVIIHNTANNLFDYIKKINYYSTLHSRANLEEKKKSNLLKIIIMPMAKFIITLFRSRNIVFSIMQSFHSFLSWSKMNINFYKK